VITLLIFNKTEQAQQIRPSVPLTGEEAKERGYVISWFRTRWKPPLFYCPAGRNFNFVRKTETGSTVALDVEKERESGASKTFHPLDVAISSLSLSPFFLSPPERTGTRVTTFHPLSRTPRGGEERHVSRTNARRERIRAFVRKIFLRLDDGTIGDESSIAEMKNLCEHTRRMI